VAADLRAGDLFQIVAAVFTSVLQPRRGTRISPAAVDLSGLESRWLNRACSRGLRPPSGPSVLRKAFQALMPSEAAASLLSGVILAFERRSVVLSKSVRLAPVTDLATSLRAICVARLFAVIGAASESLGAMTAGSAWVTFPTAIPMANVRRYLPEGQVVAQPCDDRRRSLSGRSRGGLGVRKEQKLPIHDCAKQLKLGLGRDLLVVNGAGYAVKVPGVAGHDELSFSASPLPFDQSAKSAALTLSWATTSATVSPMTVTCESSA
jgi:hypothetical protein